MYHMKQRKTGNAYNENSTKLTAFLHCLTSQDLSDTKELMNLHKDNMLCSISSHYLTRQKLPSHNFFLMDQSVEKCSLANRSDRTYEFI